MDQELVTKRAFLARLIEANEHKNRIRFRFIFINLRDVVEKKALQIFSAVHHKLHKCIMEMNSTRDSIPWGYTGSQVEQEPTASWSQEEEEHWLGCRSAWPPNAAWQSQNWQGFWGNPISHHRVPAPTCHQWWMSREEWSEWLKSTLITKPWWK